MSISQSGSLLISSLNWMLLSTSTSSPSTSKLITSSGSTTKPFCPVSCPLTTPLPFSCLDLQTNQPQWVSSFYPSGLSLVWPDGPSKRTLCSQDYHLPVPWWLCSLCPTCQSPTDLSSLNWSLSLMFHLPLYWISNLPSPMLSLLESPLDTCQLLVHWLLLPNPWLSSPVLPLLHLSLPPLLSLLSLLLLRLFPSGLNSPLDDITMLILLMVWVISDPIYLIPLWSSSQFPCWIFWLNLQLIIQPIFLLNSEDVLVEPSANHSAVHSADSSASFLLNSEDPLVEPSADHSANLHTEFWWSLSWTFS